MAISDKTRKMLWARSGNRCAVCKTELVSSKQSLVGDVIVGEECHIVSAKRNGPRHSVSLDYAFDDYRNLILLCANHHKIVDDAVTIFTDESLLVLKQNHEDWVRGCLERDAAAFANDDLHIQSLARLNTGKQVLNILIGSHAFLCDFPESISDEEASVVGDCLQDMQDYADILYDSEIQQRVEAAKHLDARIADLREIGVEVFGGERTMKIKGSKNSSPIVWQVAVVIAARYDNPAIVGDFIITATPKNMRPF